MKNGKRQLARPRWSLKSSFYTALGLFLLISPLVLVIVRKSIWTELEILTALISAAIFIYLTVILYLGVRFDRRERFVIAWPRGKQISFLEAASFTDGAFFPAMGAEAGVLGLVLGILFDIIATVVIVFVISILFWLGLNGILAVILAVCLPLFYFYRRALRSIVTKGKRCRGNLKASLFHAFKSTIGYTIWFYGIFMIVHLAVKMALR